MKYLRSLLCLGLISFSTRLHADASLDLVNPLQGTDSNIGLSHGNTLPLLATPWGMTNWSPQTSGGWGWCFRPDAKQVRGIRATHQPSPWMGDYGQFLLMPQTGELITDPNRWESPCDLSAAVFRPDYLKLTLPRYDTDVELTATDRCSLLRLTYHRGDTGRLLLDPAEHSAVEISGRSIRGWTTAVSGNGAVKGFKTYFVAQLDRDISKSGTFTSSNADFDKLSKDPTSVGGYVEFDVRDRRPVIVRVGTSFISYEQAEQNIKAEASGDFDATREVTRAAWQANLDKIDIAGGTDEQRRTFYSCLYRAQLFPHRIYELDAAGKPIHFSPYDGKVRDGHLYADNGFWDVYRTNYPFWSIVYPQQLGEILDGFTQAYKENGYFPQWPSPGNRVGMIGTHVDAVMADAIVKHVKGFDVDDAYAGIRKDAFEASPKGSPFGRPALNEYLKNGYIAAGKDGYCLSASLDYAYDDWCVAQAAAALGKAADHDELAKRSQLYRSSWDAKTGFFRPREADGSWAFEPFDEFDWAHGYVEGGPWQNTWAVPQDVAGMAELLGGKQAMCDKLDRLFGQPPIFHTQGYGGTIHEMTEMARANLGQYNHGNQPGHHIVYLYAALGEPWKTQYWSRRICRDLYHSGPDAFAGDEDNGEMACWYLLSSMGIYPLCVGDPTYTLTSPLFDRVTLHLQDGKTFNINTAHNSEHGDYVKSRTLDGQPLAAETISHGAITDGGTLQVELSEHPRMSDK